MIDHKEFMNVMSGFRRIHIASVMPGISHVEFETLKSIKELELKGNRAVKPSEIAKYLQICVPAVSRCLKGLEDRGLVERISDQKDRRVQLVRLTGEGKTTIQQAEVILKSLFESVLGSMKEEDVKQFLSFMSQLQKKAKEEIDKRKKENELGKE